MAVTVNIDSQIVVKTAAQWAADSTVYSAQRILITSDETYTGTDQRKFKIANGTDTWSNLDYFPVGGSVAWGGITGTLSDQTDLQNEFNAKLTGGEGATTGLFQSNGGNLGSNVIVATDANKKFVTLSTITYPDLTELSYVKGVTSAIQTQLNSKITLDDAYFTLAVYPGVLSPADATTYYMSPSSIAPSTTATNQDFSLGYNFTVIGAVVLCSANTTAGTTENSTLYVRNTTTSTSSTIGNFQTNGSTTVVISTTITGLTINVDANDSFCLEWLTPTWVTNPVGGTVRVILMCKRR